MHNLRGDLAAQQELGNTEQDVADEIQKGHQKQQADSRAGNPLLLPPPLRPHLAPLPPKPYPVEEVVAVRQVSNCRRPVPSPRSAPMLLDIGAQAAHIQVVEGLACVRGGALKCGVVERCGAKGEDVAPEVKV